VLPEKAVQPEEPKPDERVATPSGAPRTLICPPRRSRRLSPLISLHTTGKAQIGRKPHI